ncbi:MAG: hypothetical protein AB1679_01545 [Actinomycetota bacterium]|jgi:hypothetical protein
MAVSIQAVANPVEVVTDPLGTLIGGGVDATAGAILRMLGQAVVSGLADAARRVAEGVLSFLDASSGIHLDSGWWAGERTRAVLAVVGTLSVGLLVACCFLALLQGLLAGDPGAMMRAVLREVPVSVAGTVLLVGITSMLLRLTDAASAAVLEGAPANVGAFLARLSSAGAVTGNGLLGAVVLVVFVLGGLLVWIELLVRSALLYLLLAFAPLTLAVRVWPVARGTFRRLAELGVALIVSKFAIALALALGAAALAGDGPETGLSSAEGAGLSLSGLLAGASLMVLAAFTPFVVLRLLPIVEAAVVAQGISRTPVRAGQAGMQGAYYAQGLHRMAAGSRVSSGRPGGLTPVGGAGGAGGGTQGGSPRPPGGGAPRRGPGGPNGSNGNGTVRTSPNSSAAAGNDGVASGTGSSPASTSNSSSSRSTGPAAGTVPVGVRRGSARQQQQETGGPR